MRGLNYSGYLINIEFGIDFHDFVQLEIESKMCKYLFLLLLTVSTRVFAQKLQPEFANYVYYIQQPDSSLVRLTSEKSNGKVTPSLGKRHSVHIKYEYKLDGTKSNTRIKNSLRLTFVVLLPNKDSKLTFVLHKAEAKRKGRESFGYFQGGKAEKNIQLYRTINYQPGIYLMILENPIPGEYFFVDAGTAKDNWAASATELFSFGID